MTQVHFTLKSEEIQSIIEYSVKDDVSKNILTTVPPSTSGLANNSLALEGLQLPP